METIALQQLFYRALREKDPASIQELGKHIKGPQSLSGDRALEIYRGSVVGKLTRTLTSIYPVCCRLVGEQFFDAMAAVYIKKFPSTSPDLGDYGEYFPEFLASFPPVAQLPYLPDVARLEWHWNRVFNGEDTTELDVTALGKVPQEKWGELVFHLPKNSVFLESVYPIHRLWEINQPDYREDETVSLDEGGVKIFLWRQNYDMRIDLPNDAEWELLKAFKSGSMFEVICANLEAIEPPIDVGSLLPVFVRRGWIESFSL